MAEHDEGDDDALPAGSWLTYRYRLGSEAGAHATGTIKAPSFRDAARRLATGRLRDRLGVSPAYLRLRAAGEEEVLFELVAPAGTPAIDPVITVVPGDRFRFDPPEHMGDR
jgi:hypothetical protein